VPTTPAPAAEQELALLEAPPVKQVRREEPKEGRPRTAKESLQARGGHKNKGQKGRKGKGKAKAHSAATGREPERAAELEAPASGQAAVRTAKPAKAAKATKPSHAAKAPKSQREPVAEVAAAPKSGLWARIKGLFGGKPAP
jgi:hypothetical protein